MSVPISLWGHFHSIIQTFHSNHTSHIPFLPLFQIHSLSFINCWYVYPHISEHNLFNLYNVTRKQLSGLTIWYCIISLYAVPWKRWFSTYQHSLFASSSLSCLLGSSTRDGLLILSLLESCWLPQRYDVTTASLGLTCPDGHCCASYASWLGRTVVCFLPLESCMVQCELLLRDEAFVSIPIQRLLSSVSGV